MFVMSLMFVNVPCDSDVTELSPDLTLSVKSPKGFVVSCNSDVTELLPDLTLFVRAPKGSVVSVYSGLFCIWGLSPLDSLQGRDSCLQRLRLQHHRM